MGGTCGLGYDHGEDYESIRNAGEREAYERLISQLSDRAIGELLNECNNNPTKFRLHESVAVKKEAVKRLTGR